MDGSEEQALRVGRLTRLASVRLQRACVAAVIANIFMKTVLQRFVKMLPPTRPRLVYLREISTSFDRPQPNYLCDYRRSNNPCGGCKRSLILGAVSLSHCHQIDGLLISLSHIFYARCVCRWCFACVLGHCEARPPRAHSSTLHLTSSKMPRTRTHCARRGLHGDQQN